MMQDLVNVETAARELGLSPDAIRLAIRRGVLPAVQIDRRTKLVRRADLETYRRDHLRTRGPRPKGDATRGPDQ
jgi:excisionase family DNA binding protein